MSRKKAVQWREDEAGTGVTARRGRTRPRDATTTTPATAVTTAPGIPAVTFVDLGERSGRHDTPHLQARPLAAGAVHAVLVMMTGIDAGRVIRFEGPSLEVGRGLDSDISVEDPGVSRRHARILRSPEGAFCVEDLGSTNGTFVAMRRVGLAELSSGDHVQLGPSFVMRFSIVDDSEESLQRQLYESSVRDPLTGAFNRKYLADRLTSEIAHAHRTGGSFAVLLIDIDHFKEFNDRYGHLAGDKALRQATAALSRALRAEDVLARFGGEEFVVVTRATDAVEARALAERLRASVANLRVVPDAGSGGGASATHPAPLTVSVGLAQLSEVDPAEQGPAALIGLADQRLYGAKLRGRNQVCAENP